jgi:pseudouridine kinase
MNSDTLEKIPNLPVLVVGSAGIDIVGRLKGDIQIETSTPGHIRSSFGGVARNVAENLARLGQEVILLTVVGDDRIGSQLIQHANEAGINTDYILRTTLHPTGTYIAVLGNNGELKFAIDDMRATSVLSRKYIQDHVNLFKQSSMLFVDANLPKETLRTVISLGKRAKLKICADPTSGSLADRIAPYLKDIFLINPNNQEASILCKTPKLITNSRQALAAAKNLVGQGVKISIVTMAEQGLCYATSETSGHIPAIHTEILDSTGAGAALTAAVMFALLNGIPLDDAVRLGVSSASLTLRYQGAVVTDLSLEKLYDQLVI